MAHSAQSTTNKRPSWLHARRNERNKKLFIDTIRESSLFDDLWYAAQLKNIETTADDHVAHYVDFGSDLGLQPNPLFCPDYYLNNYCEVAEAELEPFFHYLVAGFQEDRTPHILFDPQFYKSKVKEATGEHVENPLLDYLTNADRKDISPHILFDPNYYWSQQAHEGFQPTLHRTKSLFQAPLLEFLEFGGFCNVSPHPLFHVRYYKGLVPGLDGSKINPLDHFLHHGYISRVSPHPLFNSDYYLRMNPDVHQNHYNPLMHYLRHGEAEGRDPSFFFNVKEYCERYFPRSSFAGALIHFVTNGWKRSFNPSTWIDMSQVNNARTPDDSQDTLIQIFSNLLLARPNTAIAPELYMAIKDLEQQERDPLATYLHFESRKRQKQNAKPVAQAEPSVKGLTYYGPFSVTSGLGEACRGYFRAMQAANVICHSVPTAVPDYQEQKVVQKSYAKKDWPIALAHVNADSTYPFFNTKEGKLFLEHEYRIGFWAWELPAFQTEWHTNFPSYDEIWVPSSFCLEAVSAATHLPVVLIPHVVDRQSVVEDSPAVRYEFRQKWNVPLDAHVFYYIFDASSYVDRKNPLALVEAFVKGFAKNKRAHLLLKVNYGGTNRRFKKKLKEELSPLSQSQYTIIDAVLSREDLDSLIIASDCCVSPHRSEGFGLTVAESLLLGKPTIATDFGGTTDFLTEETGFPVDYDLVEIKRDIGPYKRGNIWAQPRIDSLIDRMQEVINNPYAATARGSRGQDLIQINHNAAAIGTKVAKQL